MDEYKTSTTTKQKEKNTGITKNVTKRVMTFIH